MNETLQKNILFDEDLIQKKYDRIIDSTALCNDLEILPGGDRTEIGEKVIKLFNDNVCIYNIRTLFLYQSYVDLKSWMF